jgi:uncharacterized membrane protein
MGTLLALAIGLSIWVAGWSLGLKSFDVFLVTVLILVVAAAVRISAPFVQQLLGPDPDA